MIENNQLNNLEDKVVTEFTENYSVIVIDPAWPVKKIIRKVRPNQVSMDYPTMTLEEIRNFKLPEVSDCHLFLWTTEKHLPNSFEVLKVWGFRYICCFVWHKAGGMQPWHLPQYNCEFCLYARKGKPKFIETKNFFTCFSAKRRGNSKKPEEFYEVLRRVTAGKRIDIFNRRKIEGFDRYGDEAEE